MGIASAPIVTLATYDPNDIKPGWIAFWIVMGLCAVTVLLWLNMNKQLRKIKVPTQAEVIAQRRAESGETADENPETAPGPVDQA
jgi:hypothetical protein